MSKFTKGKWEADEFGDSVYYRDKDGHRIDFIKIKGGSPAIKQANARLIAAAPEMYEMITKLVDGITIAELLNGIQIVKVNPVLIESAKRLLAEIDGEEIKA